MHHLHYSIMWLQWNKHIKQHNRLPLNQDGQASLWNIYWYGCGGWLLKAIFILWYDLQGPGSYVQVLGAQITDPQTLFVTLFKIEKMALWNFWLMISRFRGGGIWWGQRGFLMRTKMKGLSCSIITERAYSQRGLIIKMSYMREKDSNA